VLAQLWHDCTGNYCERQSCQLYGTGNGARESECDGRRDIGGQYNGIGDSLSSRHACHCCLRLTDDGQRQRKQDSAIHGDSDE